MPRTCDPPTNTAHAPASSAAQTPADILASTFAPADPANSAPAAAPHIEAPPLELLRDFLHLYPFQPATAYWRWVEIDALLHADVPRGYGLDLGCGDGRLTQLIADRVGAWRLVGLEPDPAEITLARDWPVYEGLHNCGGDAIPEPDGRFDFVFSNSVLEHIPTLPPVLREARRVLRTGGVFLATVPSGDFHASLNGPPMWWRLFFRQDRTTYLREFDQRLAHVQYWSDERWTRELREAGFTRVELTPYFHAAHVQRWESLANCTSGWLYKLMGARRRPIEIQRRLGLRRRTQRLPDPLARALATVLARDLPTGAQPAFYGCRLIRAWA